MSNPQPKAPPRCRKNNPYQLLIFAFFLFLPGALIVRHHGQGILDHGTDKYGRQLHYEQKRRERESGAPSTPHYETVLSESELHTFGFALMLAGASVAGFYFYVRRQIALDDEIPHRRRR